VRVKVQKQLPEAATLKVITTQDKYIDPRGFYTRSGLKHLIIESDFVQENEIVANMLLLFETRKQHTWIISTNRQLLCILDFEETRSSGHLIQWKMSLTEAEPIRARTSKQGNPVVDIGIRKSWLYSHHLYPSDEAVENAIKRLIQEGLQMV
jgi:hypothetical protein